REDGLACGHIDRLRQSAQSGPYGECLRPCRRQIDPHPEEPRSGVSKDAGPSVASWFETAQGRFLIMRIWSCPMRFDLVDLQLFIAVAETRSITAGASRVHLALASASERIKGLEAALGVALLTRGRRGVELTSAGESLLDHARIVLHNVD